MTELEAKVKAVNVAHSLANAFHSPIRERLLPFLNKQVVKADGLIMEKVKKALRLEELLEGVNHYVNASSYCLWLNLKVCVSDGRGHAIYHDLGVYLGGLRNGVLVELKDVSELPTGYTAQQVEDANRQIRELKEKIDAIKSSVYPFGL